MLSLFGNKLGLSLHNISESVEILDVFEWKKVATLINYRFKISADRSVKKAYKLECSKNLLSSSCLDVLFVSTKFF